MKRAYLAALASVLLCTTAEGADVNDLLTTNWLQIVSQDQTSGETRVTFGRYAMVFNVNASGAHYSNDFRNVMNFECSEVEDRPSYINYFLPRELSVEGILGTNHLTDAKFRYQFMNKKDLWGHLEVQENQLFLDFDTLNAPIYQEMAAEVPYVLWLTDSFGVQFMTADQPDHVGEWLPGDGKKSYQDFILGQIRSQPGVTAVTPVSSRDLFTACEK
jgi:hypothetical protein